MTQKKDYPPEVWGPQFWFFIHTLTLFYPEFPNDDIKKKHYNFIYNLPFFIPHEESASNFSKLLDEVPLKPYLDTRKHFIDWAFIIHNKINKSLNKPQFDIQQFYRDFYSSYNPKQKIIDANNRYKIIIFISTVVLLSGVCYYYYNK